MRSEVLAPYTVLDLTRVRSGPTCVRQLADWGADVVKIEAPGADSPGSLGGPRTEAISRTSNATSAAWPSI